jgi:hypothetical protein
MIPELIQALAWSIVGLAFGWKICHALREVDEIREVVVHRGFGNGGGQGGRGGVGGVGGVGPGGGQGGTGGVGGVGGKGADGESGEHKVSDRPRRFLGVILMLIGLAIFAQATYTTVETRKNAADDQRRTECQAQFNDDFIKVLNERSRYADIDREELIKMINGALGGPTSQARLKAVTDYLAAMDRNDKLRQANPLPTLASRNC